MSTSNPPAAKSYGRQLTEAFLILGVGIALVAPLILFWTSWQQARLFGERTAHELAAILAEDARYALLVGSPQDARTVVTNSLKFPDLIRARIIDAHGETLADQGRAPTERARRVIEVNAAVIAREQTPDAALEPGTVTARPLGQVILTLSLDRAFASSLASARDSLLQLGILTLFLGAAVLRLSLRMLAPLGTLVRCLDDPERPEAALPTPPRTSPAEVRVIYAAIAAMRARLAANHRQLLAHAQELEARVAARTRALSAARDAAEQANRAKTLFLANVSHELRTPLQAIILHARLLDRNRRETPPEPLAVILRASQQLLDLIEQLLTLSRAEAGHPLAVSAQRFAIGALLEEVAATLRATLAPSNRLALAMPATDVWVVSDRARLIQVLYNLIRNADKFTEGGTIVLGLEHTTAPAAAVITVTDPGLGMAPAELARIFEPFYQGTQRVPGTITSGIGLGLWLTRRIVEALGARLTVTSTPGAGSCFRLDLPCSPTMAVPVFSGVSDVALAAPETPRPLGARVLLAEDEAIIRAPLAAFLREAGLQVDECADGTAALALLEQPANDYAAVILDHRLPGHLGVDILATIRAGAHPTTPVVILTGDDRAPLQAAIARLDAHLMVKPVLPERLIQTIATLIDPPEQRIANRSETP